MVTPEHLLKLPLDIQEGCLNILTQDRDYDLATYVISPQKPLTGWFIVFKANTDTFVGVTSHVPSLCRMESKNPHTKPDEEYHAYWFPRSGFNDLIESLPSRMIPCPGGYCLQPPTRQSKLHLTCHHQTDYTFFFRNIWMTSVLHKRSQTYYESWCQDGSPSYPIVYWSPPNHQEPSSLYKICFERIIQNFTLQQHQDLIRNLVSEQEYDFSTFVQVDEQPEGGCFYMFWQVDHDHRYFKEDKIEYLNIGCTLYPMAHASYDNWHVNHHSELVQNEESHRVYYAFWFPMPPYQGCIQDNSGNSLQQKVRLSCLDQDPFCSSLEIWQLIIFSQDELKFWYNHNQPKYKIVYWRPPF